MRQAGTKVFRPRSSISVELAEGAQKNIEVQVFRWFISVLIFQRETKGKPKKREYIRLNLVTLKLNISDCYRRLLTIYDEVI